MLEKVEVKPEMGRRGLTLEMPSRQRRSGAILGGQMAWGQGTRMQPRL
jgi:hypothetical protein